MVARESDTAKFRARCLTTLLGEIENKVIGKDQEITDDLVLETIGKFIKDINITISKYGEESPPDLILEREMLERFLPPKLTEAELECAIKVSIVCTDAPSIKSVMDDLKSSYKGRYDGKLAREIIEREL